MSLNEEKNGPDWIRIGEVRRRSVGLEIVSLPGSSAPDEARVSATLTKDFIRNLRRMVDERSAKLPGGVSEDRIRVSEIPGDRVSFQFNWNGMPADAVSMKRHEALDLLDGAMERMRAHRRARAFG